MVSDYAALFRTCLARSLERSMARISQVEGPLDFLDLNQALHSLSYALRQPELWPAARGLVLALAPKMERDGLREELRAVLDAALAKSSECGDTEAEAELHWHLGALLHLQANYADARAHLEASAAQYRHLGANRNQARAVARLASVARWQRRLDEAEHLVAKARELLEEGDPEHAYLLSVQGQAALDRHQWPQAAACFEQALNLATASQDQRMIAWLWVNFGMAMWKLERYQDAIRCYHEAIHVFSVVKDPVHQAVAQMDLGIMYALSNDPAGALAQYALAEPVFRQTSDVNRQAMLYNNIGYVYHMVMQQWPEAEHFYRLSIERAGEIGNLYEKCNALDNLGLAYAAQGRYQEAGAAFEEALHELAKIEHDPGYQHLVDEVATHLNQARLQSFAPL